MSSKKWIPILLSMTVLFTSCHKKNSNQEYTRFHEDGRAKPQVTVVPVLDSAFVDVSWSISDELTDLVRKKLHMKGSLFVPTLSEQNGDYAFSNSPFSNDIAWVKTSFPHQEFVAFIELTEHDIIPAKKNPKEKLSIHEIHDVSALLKMGARIRVIDNRKESPQIILQEKIKESYYLSKNTIPTDYNRVIYGTDEYLTTPLGLAHSQLTKEVSERINDYVLLAKSR